MIYNYRYYRIYKTGFSESKQVKIAGRLMSRRIQGRLFCRIAGF
jgi:hypothetical protein